MFKMFEFHEVFEAIFKKDMGYVLDLADTKKEIYLPLNKFQTLLDAAIAAQLEMEHQTERGFYMGDLMVFFGSHLNSLIIRHRNYRNGGFRIRIKAIKRGK